MNSICEDMLIERKCIVFAYYFKIKFVCNKQLRPSMSLEVMFLGF